MTQFMMNSLAENKHTYLLRYILFACVAIFLETMLDSSLSTATSTCVTRYPIRYYIMLCNVYACRWKLHLLLMNNLHWCMVKNTLYVYQYAQLSYCTYGNSHSKVICWYIYNPCQGTVLHSGITIANLDRFR